MTYITPIQYCLKIHHIRPRFKNNVENVLIYMATEISKLDRQSKTDFDLLVEEAIKKFPGNAIKRKKQSVIGERRFLLSLDFIKPMATIHGKVLEP